MKKLRNYMMFSASEIDNIEFDTICQNSVKDLKISTNNKTFVNWEKDMPKWVNNLKTKVGPFSESNIETFLAEETWAKQSFKKRISKFLGLTKR